MGLTPITLLVVATQLLLTVQDKVKGFDCTVPDGGETRMCFGLYGTAVSVCYAHALCSRAGDSVGEHAVLAGADYKELLKFLRREKQSSMTYFTSITRINERRPPFWATDGRGVEVPLASINNWPSGEPSSESDLTMIKVENPSWYFIMYDPKKVVFGSVICQLVVGSLNITNKFQREEIPSSIWYPNNVDTCEARVDNVQTIIDCNRRCQQMFECRSTFYNGLKKTCILMRYFDKYPSMRLLGWIRFKRQLS